MHLKNYLELMLICSILLLSEVVLGSNVENFPHNSSIGHSKAVVAYKVICIGKFYFINCCSYSTELELCTHGVCFLPTPGVPLTLDSSSNVKCLCTAPSTMFAHDLGFATLPHFCDWVRGTLTSPTSWCLTLLLPTGTTRMPYDSSIEVEL